MAHRASRRGAKERSGGGGSARGALAGGAALAALAAAAGLAQEPASESAADVVVVTGTAVPVELYKIGSSLTVVPGGLIEDQGYSYVPDVLRQVPGVAVSRSGPSGGLTQVRIRGAEANHTLVLLDGIDVSSPDQGETDFSTLLSGDIERIEVLRGPQSGLYGSNALAGVVSLVTRREVDGAYYRGGAEAGGLDTYRIQAGAGFGDGDDYASFGIDHLTTGGYDVSADATALGVPAVGIGGAPGDAEGNEVTTLYLRGGRKMTSVWRVDGIARVLDKHSDLDGQAFSFPIGGLTYDDASEADSKQVLLGGSATLTLLDGKWESAASVSYLDEERRGVGTSFPVFTGPDLPAPADLAVPLDPTGADAARTTVGAKSTVEIGSPGFVSRLTGFVESEEETYRNPFPASPTQAGRRKRDLLGVGAEYRAEIAEQLYLSGSVRHDDNDDFEDADTWSVSASWAVPGIGSRPHASLGTGVTDPTFFEQFGFDPGTFAGNPDLLPEKAEGWDVGFEQTIGGGLAVVDVTYFESTLEHEIFTDFGPPPDFLSTPANRDAESERGGWEATVRLRPIDGLDIFGSYTDLDATEPAGIEVRRPESQASLDALWDVGGGPFQLDLGVTYNGEQQDTDLGTFLRTDMDAYTLVRLGGSYAVSGRLEIYARVENLTDEAYEEVINYLGSPRTAFVGFRYRGGR